MLRGLIEHRPHTTDHTTAKMEGSQQTQSQGASKQAMIYICGGKSKFSDRLNKLFGVWIDFLSDALKNGTRGCQPLYDSPSEFERVSDNVSHASNYAKFNWR